MDASANEVFTRMLNYTGPVPQVECRDNQYMMNGPCENTVSQAEHDNGYYIGSSPIDEIDNKELIALMSSTK